MTSMLGWILLFLSICAWNWAPTEGIAGGRRVSVEETYSIGKIISNGQFLSAATAFRAVKAGKLVIIAISAVRRDLSLNETLQYVGLNTDRINNTSGVVLNVTNIIQYPGFTQSNPNRDNLVLLELEGPTWKIKTFCIMANSTLPQNQKLYVQGWGAILNGPLNGQLRNMFRALAKLMNLNECRAKYNFSNFPGPAQSSDIICTDNRQTGTCGNDQGAPVFTEGIDAVCVVYAITTHGGNCNCSDPIRPGVHKTNLNILHWIRGEGYLGTDVVQLSIPKRKARSPMSHMADYGDYH